MVIRHVIDSAITLPLHGAMHSFVAAIVLAAIGMALASDAANGAEPDWPNEPYQYIVVDQDLRDVLDAFGNNLGFLVSSSDSVKGRVRGELPPLPPREFLSRLAERYGFDWYFDGRVMYVTSTEETATRLLPLGKVEFARLAQDLDSLGVTDARYAIRHSEASRLLLVSGPPRYVALVEQTLNVLNSAPPIEVRVFRGTGATQTVDRSP